MIEISYGRFLWEYVLIKQRRQNLLDLGEKKFSRLINSEFNEDIDILLLHDINISRELSNIIMKNREKIEEIERNLDKSDITISDSSKFRYNKLLEITYSAEKPTTAKIMLITGRKLNKIHKEERESIEKKLELFSKILKNGARLTVKGYFNDDFKDELISIMGSPKVWFKWDNISGELEIFNDLDELRDEYDEDQYERYNQQSDLLQIGILIDEKYIPDEFKPYMTEFCKLESGSVDKAEYLEPNERILGKLYGIILLEGIPSLIEDYLDKIEIKTDLE